LDKLVALLGKQGAHVPATAVACRSARSAAASILAIIILILTD